MDYKELKETIDILEKLPDGDRDKMLKLVLTNKNVEQEKPAASYKQKGLIEKDGEHILTTHDATLLLIYIKELEAYADKLSLQNKILKGDKDEMSIH